MKHTITVINVARIVQQFIENEARTLQISKGKMLNDVEEKEEFEKYLKVG